MEEINMTNAVLSILNLGLAWFNMCDSKIMMRMNLIVGVGCGITAFL